MFSVIFYNVKFPLLGSYYYYLQGPDEVGAPPKYSYYYYYYYYWLRPTFSYLPFFVFRVNDSEVTDFLGNVAFLSGKLLFRSVKMCFTPYNLMRLGSPHFIDFTYL